MRSRLAAFCILISLSILGSACATTRAQHSGRKGFFAHMAEMNRKNRNGAKSSVRRGSSKTSGAKVADDSGPGTGRSSASMRRLSQVTSRWGWPLKSVSVTSDFGVRKGQHHEGVDLKAASGTPVYSAGPGVVLYAGNRISGYGNMVIVGHDGDLSTIYAHNSRLHVKKGDRVKAGDRIALSGNTGHSSGPHLHFEVRSGLVALDPLKVMPSRRGLASSSKRTRGLASADIHSPR